MPSDDGNGHSYWGSYDGSPLPFSGIATDEIYLIKSECLARAGKFTEAMQVLNTLLEKRWIAGTFFPLSATGTAALDIILSERRKELVLRGLRWSDLRRLNKIRALLKK
ncbi:RagB/SusD family nutrient uptake outer membrane protein [Flavobacterium sp. RHBU_24]|uniref:RagB/SusD family nutrient uptake outer membrane protein n=1 Tax=Flavobacterium sp. RHBU_24 TaxID=3391185 RepID=UPI003984D792